jgi:peroxiredoxin Q/BCP
MRKPAREQGRYTGDSANIGLQRSAIVGGCQYPALSVPLLTRGLLHLASDIITRNMLKEGDKAPDFTSKDQNGAEVKLSDLKGQRVVLYFYPKDDTPGCTKEACSFRDADDVYRKENIRVLGVSTDDEKSHQKFISKFSLPFDLLADTDKEIVNAYGVWGEKSMYGKKYMGTNRKTFLIDADGKIAKVFDKVDVAAHADEVLAAFGEK